MKLVCLSSNPSKPCFILYFKGVTLMLDCGLDVTQLQHFLPIPVVPGTQISKARSWSPGFERKSKVGDISQELKECSGRLFVDGCFEMATPEFDIVDLAQIDAILISNSTCMLALPYVTEYTGFKGHIYATEPALQVGRMYMEELVHYVERNPRTNIASKWKQEDILKNLPPPLKDAVNVLQWKQCFTKHDIDACLSKVTVVGFNQKMTSNPSLYWLPNMLIDTDIYGAVVATPISSGYSLGSSNWVIKSTHEKVCYISGTSTLTTHPKPMEQTPLRNSDVLIVSCLTQTPLANPDAMIGEFCVNTAVTLKNGGNVLVPCYPSGVTYDLFECLSAHLEQCGLATIPMYFLSPVSDSALAYSNIFAEWLSQGKQSKVYLPECPFPHAELQNQGRLKNFKSLQDMNLEVKTPCVVFAGHPSLRMGDVIHFVELWGKHSANTIIFTEPDFPYLEALGPFQPIAMRVCYCPIDTSLNFGQANKLIKDLHPLHLVVSESYTIPPIMAARRTDLVIDWEPSPFTYKQGQVLSLPVKRKYESIEIDTKLASKMEPVEVKPGSAITMITGSLNVRDNVYVLKPLPEDGEKKSKEGFKVHKKSYIFGSPNIQAFVDVMSQQGISSIKVEDIGNGSIIHLPNDDTLIQVDGDSTHIICQGDESIRVKIRDSLIRCLKRL